MKSRERRLPVKLLQTDSLKLRYLPLAGQQQSEPNAGGVEERGQNFVHIMKEKTEDPWIRQVMVTT